MTLESLQENLQEAEREKRKKVAELKRKERERLRVQKAVITVGIRASTHLPQDEGGEEVTISPELEMLGLPQDPNKSFMENLRTAVRLCRNGGLNPTQIAKRFLVAAGDRQRTVGRTIGTLPKPDDEAFVRTFASAVEIVFEEVNRDNLTKRQRRRLSVKS